MLLRKFLLIWSLALSTGWASAEEPDWSHYRSLLSHVRPSVKNGVSLMKVDYAEIKRNGILAKAYQALSGFDTGLLANRQEKLAFFINAYNILALKMVVDHWPTESIKDVGSLFSPVWDKPAGLIGGKNVTLGEIEHQILRPMGEPRIHMAIVCASVSCPNLRAEPYVANTLNEQLDEQTRQFLENSGKGLRIANNVVRVSKIFDWFEEDFEVYGGVKAFLKRYKALIPDLKIKANLPYDWLVNG